MKSWEDFKKELSNWQQQIADAYTEIGTGIVNLKYLSSQLNRLHYDCTQDQKSMARDIEKTALTLTNAMENFYRVEEAMAKLLVVQNIKY